MTMGGGTGTRPIRSSGCMQLGSLLRVHLYGFLLCAGEQFRSVMGELETLGGGKRGLDRRGASEKGYLSMDGGGPSTIDGSSEGPFSAE